MKLREDEELRDLVPRAVDSDLAGLERSILSEGCRDPLVAWRPPGEEAKPPVLLDGYTRYKICDKHDVAYEVTELRFGSREDAKAWIIDAQLSRRNLTTAGRCELALGLEPLLKAAAAERRRRGGGVGGRGGKSKLPPNSTEASSEGSEPGNLVRSLLRARGLPERGEARVQAAKLARVGRNSVDSYEEIKNAAEIEGHEYAKELLGKLQDPAEDLSVNGAKNDLGRQKEYEEREAGWAAEEEEDEQSLNSEATESGEGGAEPSDEDDAAADPAGEPIDGIPTRRPHKWPREMPIWCSGKFQGFVGSLRKRSVKLLLTDPPYGAGVGKTFTGDENPEVAANLLAQMLDGFKEKLKSEAHVIVFCGLRQRDRMREEVKEKAPYLVERDPFVWVKNKPGKLEAEGSVYGDPRSLAPAYEIALHYTQGEPRLRSRKPNAYIAPRIPAATRGHETEKPVGMLRQIIEATTGFGAVVADPFGGTASTLEAALCSRRRAWGSEKEAKHHLTGTQRLKAVMGELSQVGTQPPLPGLEMVLQDINGQDLVPAQLATLPDPLPGIPTTIWGFGEPPEEFRVAAESLEDGPSAEGYYIRHSDAPDYSGGGVWRVVANAGGQALDELVGIFDRRLEAERAVREHARERGVTRDVWVAEPGDDSYFEMPDLWDE